MIDKPIQEKATGPAIRRLSYFRGDPNQRYTRRVTDAEAEAELIVNGQGWFGEDARHCGAGTLLWFQPGDLIQAVTRDAPYECLAINFHASSAAHWPGGIYAWPDRETIQRFTHDILQAYHHDQRSLASIGAYAYGVLSWHARQPAIPRPLPPPVQQLQGIIDERYAEPLQLADLAHLTGVSASHLTVLCRQHLSITPHQLLTQRRMAAARTLLAISDTPIKVVAVDCGYRSSIHFCRAFRQRHGTSPAAYRMANQARFDGQ